MRFDADRGGKWEFWFQIQGNMREMTFDFVISFCCYDGRLHFEGKEVRVVEVFVTRVLLLLLWLFSSDFRCLSGPVGFALATVVHVAVERNEKMWQMFNLLVFLVCFSPRYREMLNTYLQQAPPWFQTHMGSTDLEEICPVVFQVLPDKSCGSIYGTTTSKKLSAERQHDNYKPILPHQIFAKTVRNLTTVSPYYCSTTTAVQ